MKLILNIFTVLVSIVKMISENQFQFVSQTHQAPKIHLGNTQEVLGSPKVCAHGFKITPNKYPTIERCECLREIPSNEDGGKVFGKLSMVGYVEHFQHFFNVRTDDVSKEIDWRNVISPDNKEIYGRNVFSPDKKQVDATTPLESADDTDVSTKRQICS